MGYYINTGTRTEFDRFDDIKAILSAGVVRDIYDDDNDGEPDNSPLLWLEKTAEDQFESGLHGIFPDLAVLRANPCATCERIVGEFVMALAAIRFPRAYGRDFERLMKVARDSVDRIRTGKDRLAIQGVPNPPANSGGDVYSGSAPTCVNDDTQSIFYNGGTGIF